MPPPFSTGFLTPLVPLVTLQGSPEALEFSWLLRLALLAAYLLLPAAGLLLTHRTRGRQSGSIHWYTLATLMGALSVAVMHYNGLLTWPGWLGASLMFFVPCVVAGAGLATALALAKRGRSWPSRLLFVGAAIPLLLLAFSSPLGGLAGVTSMTGDYYYGWGLCAVPPFIGGSCWPTP